ncbi:glycosyltransferase family 4 protein [Flammeovirga sp. EKP202]|uniref:glycosyltransferase family 4 protein n=1 Tax=Flammeovirga sp. EKP202 TaxID=2770592 RepID=UPI00165FAC0F|nr:glycosyltransferase family 4 protein [Flammeovirga sp. EKP202]MBD0401248.1 glycosyltransferase family 4 protein [Flammeovirga sp. EKP202]
MILKSNKFKNINEYISNNTDLNICIITHCYPPDFGAAPHQYAHMAESFHAIGHNVTVLTSHPYYPKGKLQRKDFFKLRRHTKINGIDVFRHWLIPSQQNSAILRLLSMTTMLLSMLFSMNLLKKKQIDVVIVQTPPITLPLLGILLKRIQKVKLVLNVSDLWPQAMVDLGSIKTNSIAYQILHRLEKFYYSKADFIITQSDETKSYIQDLNFNDVFLYRIGADINVFHPHKNVQRGEKLKIVYTGVLGVAHGILDLIQKVSFDALNCELHIYGDGIEKNKIKNYIIKNQLQNVILHPKVHYKEVPEVVKQYDVALISQKKYVKGTLPAKLYESLSLGMPILFHGQGEGEQLVQKHQCGFTSRPNDLVQLTNNIKTLQQLSDQEFQLLSTQSRKAAVNHYDRDLQFSTFYEALKTVTHHLIFA